MHDKDIIQEMNRYYALHALQHDECMGYTTNAVMEKLLGPIISMVEDKLADQNVLEIACGTGNWTQVLAKRARSVLATDINETVIDIARQKTDTQGNVSYQIADAYTLNSIDGDFGAAFAADWWSHIPKSRIPAFLKCLHGRLTIGADVIFIDMMPKESLDKMFSHIDGDGNIIQMRTLPDGREYHVVKNHPTEEELRGYLSGFADQVQYHEDHTLQRWVLNYPHALQRQLVGHKPVIIESRDNQQVLFSDIFKVGQGYPRRGCVQKFRLLSFGSDVKYSAVIIGDNIIAITVSSDSIHDGIFTQANDCGHFFG
jgi:demethylmenaquinone methyltransferase/2-methoxy-6-polyprenyl-1,4-benzoquinol methylase